MVLEKKTKIQKVTTTTKDNGHILIRIKPTWTFASGEQKKKNPIKPLIIILVDLIFLALNMAKCCYEKTCIWISRTCYTGSTDPGTFVKTCLSWAFYGSCNPSITSVVRVAWSTGILIMTVIFSGAVRKKSYTLIRVGDGKLLRACAVVWKCLCVPFGVSWTSSIYNYSLL